MTSVVRDESGSDGWQAARLIPTSGINGPEEAERRATSALLAVMSAVREFSLALTKPYGAPASWLQTFIEVPFKLDDKTVIPDGLIRAERGSKSWTALVEVKTGSMCLQAEQIERYLDVARAQGFDAVITISNEISHHPGVHPVKVDGRKTRSVALHHLSWAEIITEANKQAIFRGVADPDQAWILAELIRYLEHQKSGANDFDDMGEAWVTVRNSVANSTLRRSDAGLIEMVQKWEQLLRFSALLLGRELGADVEVVRSRAELADPDARVLSQADELVSKGTLSGSLRIPAAVGDLGLVADLRAGRISVYVEIDAPREGRPTTRVNWLTRQLADAPPQMCIDAWSQGARTSMSELLNVVRERPETLIGDPKRDLRRFRLTASAALGSGRGLGKGSFITSVLNTTQTFYEDVVQMLRPWTPKAPQLPSGGRSAAEEAGIDTRTPLADLEPSERRHDHDGRQGLFAPPSGPPQRPEWLTEPPVPHEEPND